MQGDALGESGNYRVFFFYKLKEEDTHHEMTYTEKDTDLGVVIDGKLDFEKHINFKINMQVALWQSYEDHL